MTNIMNEANAISKARPTVLDNWEKETKMKNKYIFAITGLVLFFGIVGLPADVNSLQRSQDVVTKEMVKQRQRVARLVRPATMQKTERSKKAFQTRLFSGQGEPDCYRQAYEALQSEFQQLSQIETEILMVPVISDTLQDLEKDMKELYRESGKLEQSKSKLQRQIRENRQIVAESGSNPTPGQQRSSVKKTGKPLKPVHRFKSQPGMKKTARLGMTYPQTPVVSALPVTANMTAAERNSLLKDLQAQQDSLNELSEMISLKLQMAMDRRSKLLATLSQIMKKISTTQDSLIQNIK